MLRDRILRPRTNTYLLCLLFDLDTRASVFALTANLEAGPRLAEIWWTVLVDLLLGLTNWAPTSTTEQRPFLAPEIKIMWEEQLADPSNDYITSVNVP